MPDFRFTAYFEGEVLRKRTYLTKEACIAVVTYPLRSEVQSDGRVVTLADRVTIHNAFFDRRFAP
jgi:hypothetical protein